MLFSPKRRKRFRNGSRHRAFRLRDLIHKGSIPRDVELRIKRSWVRIPPGSLAGSQENQGFQLSFCLREEWPDGQQKCQKVLKNALNGCQTVVSSHDGLTTTRLYMSVFFGFWGEECIQFFNCFCFPFISDVVVDLHNHFLI